MSTSVCQGQQSCLEPGLVEHRVLKLKLALPNVNTEPQQIPQTDENDNAFGLNDNKNVDVKGWSFLQDLANTKNDIKTEKVYVHPMVKRSASMLSAESLEMCTESLGSETGSDTGDSCGEEMSLLSVKSEKSAAIQGLNLRKVQTPKRLLNRSMSFPPPLTTISSSSGLQVRPRREDGRLVLKAVLVSSAPSIFHAERADGRLKLRSMKYEAENEDKQEEEIVEEDGVETEMEDEVYDEKEEEEEEEEEDDDYDETEEVLLSGDMEENGGNVRDEMGNGKFRRPSKCKEDERENRVLKSWEPVLVVT